jgi:hypothetical protein
MPGWIMGKASCERTFAVRNFGYGCEASTKRAVFPMTPGQLVRKILGPAFPMVGEAYRRIFVDMARVVATLSPHIPQNARVLEVGGGDGYVVNLLLNLRPDLRVTMTDLALSIGSFISDENRAKVMLLPATDIVDVAGAFDVIILADVVHHVPAASRPEFYATIVAAARRVGAAKVLIKDLQPGAFRSLLSLWSDLYITGDKGVSLVRSDDLRLPGFQCTWSAMPDFPNYCLAFEPR